MFLFILFSIKNINKYIDEWRCTYV
jgi:hypothetical protein